MTVLLIGCGRMGGALARGWAGREVLAYDPSTATLPPDIRRVEALDFSGLPANLTIFIAMKPQTFADVASMIAPVAARGDALLVSIMAGASLATLTERLGGSPRLARAMPNTPASIVRGITAAVAGAGVGDSNREEVDGLLRAGGEVVWLDAESDLDAVTAGSGSGPAYFFRFAEALASAGEHGGLAPELAMRLARATFTGAAALEDARPETLAVLRTEVTSPGGGTTAAGVGRLDEGHALDRLTADV